MSRLSLPRRAHWSDALALAAVVTLATAYTLAVVWERAQRNEGLPNFDAYVYTYPNLAYMLESLRRGYGLLWNTFQNCGQPFLANQQVALFYPPDALWLLGDIDATMIALYGVHLVVAGAGMYWLGRVIGLRAVAALCGAVLFQLGGITLWLGYWQLVLLAVYAWFPAAIAAAERLLQGPSPAYVVALGVILTMQLLAGHPQILVFTYQVIVLRLLWEMAVQRALLPGRAMAILAALCIPPLLGAIQLFPTLEFNAQSLRAGPLSPPEIRPPALAFTWDGFRQSVSRRQGYGALVSSAGFGLMVLAVGNRRRRLIALFYAGIAVLYAVLAFDNPVFDVYRRLPLGSAFREPERFLWVTALAAALLAAVGAEALLDRTAAAPRRSGLLLAVVAAAGALWWLSPTGLDWLAIACMAALAVLLVVARLNAPRAAVGVLLLLLVSAELWIGTSRSLFGFLADGAQLFDERPVHRALRARMTEQDRMYQLPSRAGERVAPGIGVIEKSAEVLRLRSILDYEPQTSDRYARLTVRMLYGKPMSSLNLFYFHLRPVPANAPLFNLVATRFVVADAEDSGPAAAWLRAPSFRLAWAEGGTRVYENLAALPRAAFVPMARAIVDPAALLERLAATDHDPRSTVLVEDPRLDGVGDPSAHGSATIVEDRGELVVVRVESSGPGFLVLSDQLFPGWEATVNGTAAPITRANYAFRAVQVGAGNSEVVFRYHSRFLWLGAGISAATALLLASVFGWHWRRHRSRLSGG